MPDSLSTLKHLSWRVTLFPCHSLLYSNSHNFSCQSSPKCHPAILQPSSTTKHIYSWLRSFLSRLFCASGLVWKPTSAVIKQLGFKLASSVPLKSQSDQITQIPQPQTERCLILSIQHAHAHSQISFSLLLHSFSLVLTQHTEQPSPSQPQRKYGVCVRGGITRSLSGTALKSLASWCSVSVKARTAAMLPQR